MNRERAIRLELAQLVHGEQEPPLQDELENSMIVQRLRRD